jgi:shikimate kinase
MKIFLIGMPGVGKSTLGRQLADKLILPFIDLDIEIEREQQASISEIFREKGEDFFRQIEAQSLRKICDQQHSFVMATGGGTPCFHQSVDYMKGQGYVLFLDIDLAVIHDRIKNSSSRPLLAIESDFELKLRLESIRKKRIAFYEKAHITFTGEGLSAEAIAHAIMVLRMEIQ